VKVHHDIFLLQIGMCVYYIVIIMFTNCSTLDADINYHQAPLPPALKHTTQPVKQKDIYRNQRSMSLGHDALLSTVRMAQPGSIIQVMTANSTTAR
jgi:hypothetical protein